jgi:hypothetical protein
MFVPPEEAGNARHLRIAFANLDRPGIHQMFERLQTLVM